MSDGVSPVARWFRSLRAYSFPASMMPVVLSVPVALEGARTIVWWTLVPFACAAILFHAGTNVLNDYWDWTHGVDRPGDPDPTHAIPQGVVTPRFMLVSGHIYFVLGVLSGASIAVLRGPLFLAAGLIGAFGAYAYTARRFSLKYRALGDLTVFLLMGPAMVLIGEWALTGTPSWRSVIAAVPMAFLVTAILHGNNLRDIQVDGVAGVDTVARRLGFARSRILFAGMIAVAYLLLPAALWGSGLSLLGIAGYLSVLSAAKLVRRVLRARSEAELLDLPLHTAIVHMQFGVLQTTGALIGWGVGL